MAPQAGYISEMSGDFERRSIVLTLQELADKTPAGEPLLVTAAERRAYLQFLRTRAIQPEGFASSVEMFAGRELKVIDEAIVIPKRLMGARITITGAAIRDSVRDGKGAFMAAPQIDKSNTKIRYLLNRLRQALGQDQLSPSDVAKINELVEAGPAVEVDRVERELADRLRELMVSSEEEKYKLARDMAAQGPMFVGEDARFPGMASMANQIQDTVYQRKVNAMEAQRQMNGLRSMGIEAANAPAETYAGISRADIANFKSEPGQTIEYRSGWNESDIPERIDAIIRGDVPEFAKGSQEAFRNFVMAQLAQEDARAMNAAGPAAGPQQKQRAPSSTVKNIPVGVSRSYFEE